MWGHQRGCSTPPLTNHISSRVMLGDPLAQLGQWVFAMGSLGRGQSSQGNSICKGSEVGKNRRVLQQFLCLFTNGVVEAQAREGIGPTMGVGTSFVSPDSQARKASVCLMGRGGGGEKQEEGEFGAHEALTTVSSCLVNVQLSCKEVETRLSPVCLQIFSLRSPKCRPHPHLPLLQPGPLQTKPRAVSSQPPEHIVGQQLTLRLL